MDWVMRDKKTGEIITILSTIMSSSKFDICYSGKDGKSRILTEDEFYKKFEPIDIDYSKLFPFLAEAAKVDGEIRDMLNWIARKCLPDYYNVGDRVFLCKQDNGMDSLFHGYVKSSIGWSYNDQRVSFIIDKIVEVGEIERGCFMITLKEDSGNHFDVPLYRNRLLSKDISYYLKRYDREF